MNPTDFQPDRKFKIAARRHFSNHKKCEKIIGWIYTWGWSICWPTCSSICLSIWSKCNQTASIKMPCIVILLFDNEAFFVNVYPDNLKNMLTSVISKLCTYGHFLILKYWHGLFFYFVRGCDPIHLPMCVSFCTWMSVVLFMEIFQTSNKLLSSTFQCWFQYIFTYFFKKEVHWN